MVIVLNQDAPIKKLVESLAEGNDIVLPVKEGVAAVHRNEQVVEIVLQLYPQPDNIGSWLGWYRCPFSIFQQLLDATEEPTAFTALNELHGFVEHSRNWSNHYIELFDEYSESPSREEMAKKVGFNWWEHIQS